MKKTFLSILLLLNSLWVGVTAQPPPPPGNPGNVDGVANSPVGSAEIGDGALLLIIFALAYGTYRYFRYNKEHIGADKTIV